MNENPIQGMPYDSTSFVSLEEKIDFLEEKINLITKSFIEIKEEFQKKINEIEKQQLMTKLEIEGIKKTIKNIFFEIENFAKRDDLIIIEKMLRDFQPLEFVRKKDLEEYLEKIKKEEYVKK